MENQIVTKKQLDARIYYYLYNRMKRAEVDAILDKQRIYAPLTESETATLEKYNNKKAYAKAYSKERYKEMKDLNKVGYKISRVTCAICNKMVGAQYLEKHKLTKSHLEHARIMVYKLLFFEKS